VSFDTPNRLRNSEVLILQCLVMACDVHGDGVFSSDEYKIFLLKFFFALNLIDFIFFCPEARNVHDCWKFVFIKEIA
jgi:hypothetical protein